MPRFESFRNVSQGLMYWAIIIVVGLGIVWLIISGIGSCIIARSALPEPPDTLYQVGIHATGQILYTDDYNIFPSEKGDGHKVILHGYYYLAKGKYNYNDGDLPLDEYYFGDIEVRRRN